MSYMYVCLSVWLAVCPHEISLLTLKDFHETLYLSIFGKSVEKIQVSLQSDKNNGYTT